MTPPEEKDRCICEAEARAAGFHCVAHLPLFTLSEQINWLFETGRSRWAFQRHSVSITYWIEDQAEADAFRQKFEGVDWCVVHMVNGRVGSVMSPYATKETARAEFHRCIIQRGAVGQHWVVPRTRPEEYRFPDASRAFDFEQGEIV